ncbi:MAG: hypothetical protein DRH11_08155, partial [Deltaproteobacteria bacterium]
MCRACEVVRSLICASETFAFAMRSKLSKNTKLFYLAPVLPEFKENLCVTIYRLNIISSAAQLLGSTRREIFVR